MYKYILCEFTYGYNGKLYQEILEGNVMRLTDIDGNTLDLITPNISYGYHVINSDCETPSWGTM